MQPTKWWKCDLQVATPAWDFKFAAGDNFDFLDDKDQVRFADLYMKRVKAGGVEVIALADHNTHGWIDIMCAAGERNGVIVFTRVPVTLGRERCEITKFSWPTLLSYRRCGQRLKSSRGS